MTNPMLLLVFVAMFIPVAASWSSRPFRPHPSLAPLRATVMGTVAIGVGMLLLSLGSDWWVIEDWEREETIVADAGSSTLVWSIVVSGLVSAVLTVTAARGRRNWAPVALTMAWLLVAAGWFSSTGEFVDSDAGGDADLGLSLGTWAVLVVTIAAVVGSVGRLFERRAAGRSASAISD